MFLGTTLPALVSASLVSGLVSTGALGLVSTAWPGSSPEPAERTQVRGAAATAPEPVTRLALTDSAGRRTDVAVAGIEDLLATAPAQAGVVPLPSSAGEAGGADDPADVAVLTPPMATKDFMVAALTWRAGETLPDGGEVFVRVLEDGAWSPWLEAADDQASESGPEGTEPFVTGGAEAVQVEVTGNAAGLPADLALSLIPANPRPAVETITTPLPEPATTPDEEPSGRAAEELAFGRLAVAPVPTALARPAVVNRAGWGADESLMTWSPTYATLKAAVVHHTAGTNSYTAAESASIVRGIYHYHAVTRDWGDIGYNFLVDKFGTIFEGRSGTLGAGATVMPIGAHALNFNTGSMGLSAMGDYSQVAAPQIILDAMADVIAWKFDVAGIDPATPSGFTSPGTSSRPAGQALPRIFAHRDVGATVCPGDDIYDRLDDLRAAVADLMAPEPEPEPEPEPQPQAFADVPPGAAFYEDIQWLWDRGISKGSVQPDGRRLFEPSAPVRREAMAAFLYRFAGEPPFTPSDPGPFVDVAPGDAFATEIAWLHDEGITTGMPVGEGLYEFRPADPVSREAMAAFLFRFKGSPAFTPPATSPFVDVPTDHAFYAEIAWLAENGISTGTAVGGGRVEFRPSEAVTREAMAAFLHRTDGLP